MNRMPVGTRTYLFGAHQFLLHPLFVMLAWYRLFGFTMDPRIYLAAFLHDIGYIGCHEIDGPEGSQHPLLGGHIMFLLFGYDWGVFTTCHSRELAKSYGFQPSKLAAADKLSMALIPNKWLCVLQWLSGEIELYHPGLTWQRQIEITRWYQTKCLADAMVLAHTIRKPGNQCQKLK